MAEFAYFRYVLAFIAFYLMLVVNLTRSDFNVTILKMINNNCSEDETHDNKTFCWSKETEELLVSSYFIGYVFQLPGGILANLYGAYYICGFGILVLVTLTFLTPLATANWRILLAVRLVQGLAAAPTMPAMSTLWSRWAPKNEKSTLFSLTVAGHFIGAAAGDALTGVLCNQTTMFGGDWPSVFRIYGIVGLLLLVLWVTFASSDPDRSIWTSLDERDYIALNRAPLRRSTRIPWLWVLTAGRCWAIYFCHICSYFGYLTILIGYPQYLKDIQNMDIEDIGAYASIPILAMFLSSVIAGRVTDIILKREILSVTAVRKINTSIGMFIPGALNFAIAFWPKLSWTAIIILMSLQSAANGFVLSGYMVNYIDINPDHAGVTMGVGNSLASFVGAAIPLLMYKFDKSAKLATTRAELASVDNEWRDMFINVGAAMTIGGLVYCLVGTGERQMAGMEGYVEIAGTDSAAEQTTINRTTVTNNTVTSERFSDRVVVPERASIDWSEPELLPIIGEEQVEVPSVKSGGESIDQRKTPVYATAESKEAIEEQDLGLIKSDKALSNHDVNEQQAKSSDIVTEQQAKSSDNVTDKVDPLIALTRSLETETLVTSLMSQDPCEPMIKESSVELCPEVRSGPPARRYTVHVPVTRRPLPEPSKGRRSSAVDTAVVSAEEVMESLKRKELSMKEEVVYSDRVIDERYSSTGKHGTDDKTGWSDNDSDRTQLAESMADSDVEAMEREKEEVEKEAEGEEEKADEDDKAVKVEEIQRKEENPETLFEEPDKIVEAESSVNVGDVSYSSDTGRDRAMSVKSLNSVLAAGML